MRAECEQVQSGPRIPMTHVPTGSTHSGNPKAPVQLLYIEQDDYTLTLPALGYSFTLRLLDADGVVAYETFVPAGTTTVVLPSTLSGDYELRLVTSTFYFYGYITL